MWFASIELETTSASMGVNTRKFSPLINVISTSLLLPNIRSRRAGLRIRLRSHHPESVFYAFSSESSRTGPFDLKPLAGYFATCTH